MLKKIKCYVHFKTKIYKFIKNIKQNHYKNQNRQQNNRNYLKKVFPLLLMRIRCKSLIIVIQPHIIQLNYLIQKVHFLKTALIIKLFSKVAKNSKIN